MVSFPALMQVSCVLPAVSGGGVFGKNHCLTPSHLSYFLTCPEQDSNSGSDERQRAVTGKSLHLGPSTLQAIRAGQFLKSHCLCPVALKHWALLL